jgi:hypothetical protein
MTTQQDLRQLADRHAKEAERLLAGRMGWINSTLKAGVHASLAIYYSAEARRTD